MLTLREVNIIVINITTGEKYLAKSYPDADYDNNNKIESYNIPVYYVTINVRDKHSNNKSIKWKALRFMPYWNDPKALEERYKTPGWAN